MPAAECTVTGCEFQAPGLANEKSSLVKFCPLPRQAFVYLGQRAQSRPTDAVVVAVRRSSMLYGVSLQARYVVSVTCMRCDA
jgi:hypothetical protein